MRSERCEVLIIGAGPAGLAAAITLHALGIRGVIVVEREEAPGGTPRYCHNPGFGLQDLRRLLSGPAYAQAYIEKAQALGIDIRTETMVTDWLGPCAVQLTSPRGIGRLEAQAILLATGCRERPRSARLIPGSRPQGVFTTGSLQRFLQESRETIGRRAVIVGAELISLSALHIALRAGIAVVAMVTEWDRPQIPFPYSLAQWYWAELRKRIRVICRSRVTQVMGQRRVEAVEITNLDSGDREVIACDTVIFTGDWIPENELARAAGIALDSGTRGPRVDAHLRTSQPGIFAAGNVLRGAEMAGIAALEGRHAARAIQGYLERGEWPSYRLPIRVAPPLQWICPNEITSTQEIPPSGVFRLRASGFLENAWIEVRQGKHLLYVKKVGRMIPNQSYKLPASWISDVDLGKEPVEIYIRSRGSSH